MKLLKQNVNGLVGILGATLLTTACAPGAMEGITNLSDSRFSTAGSASFVQDGVAGQSVSAQASGLSVSLSLSVAAPPTTSTGGVQLYASDLKLYGTKVITGYNVPGAVERGWLDYIDVTTLAAPLLINSVYLSDTDVNGIAMYGTLLGGKFAISGAQDQNGAIVRVGSYSLNMALESSADAVYLGHNAGTGAAFNADGSRLAVTSGVNGGLTVFDTSTSPLQVSSQLGQVLQDDVRAVTFSNNKYFTVKGHTSASTHAAVTSYSATGFSNSTTGTTTNLNTSSVANSKATIVAGSTYLLATSGDGGFQVLCAADMGIMATVPQFTFPVGSGNPGAADTVTNAAAFGPGLIFTAAGAAGVRVYNFQSALGTTGACGNVNVTYSGYFNISGSVSANNLVYQNILSTGLTYTGVLYVAAGSGGFKALTVVATPGLSDLIQ